MAELKRITAEEFIVLAERHERPYKYGKALVYCERCANKPKPYLTETNDCHVCGGKGMSIVIFPILIHQKMTPEDFDFLKLAIRLGEQYG